MNKLTFWVCSKCNGIVDQPCCRIDTAKLKPGVIPKGCIMLRGYRAEWRQESRAPIAQQAIAGPNDGLKPCPECKVPEFYYRKDGIYCWNCGKQLYKWVGTASAIAGRCTPSPLKLEARCDKSNDKMQKVSDYLHQADGPRTQVL